MKPRFTFKLIFLGVFAIMICEAYCRIVYEDKINQKFGSRISTQQVEQCISLHNKARNKVGVPPIEWSNELATYAQKWADHLASSGCKMAHRPPSGEWKQVHGENLFMGTVGYYDVADAVKSWESEKKFYKGTLTMKNFSKVGHYTQMVWTSTTHVGCGIAVCGDNVIIVCNYNPAGNMLGEKAY